MSDKIRVSSLGRLLSHVLEQPELVRWVQALPPRTLHRLIHQVGLEDAGELLSLCSAAQLQEVFDEDLWRSRGPGQEEAFDAERFALWLEVLLEAGPEAAARRLVTLDEDLVTMALSRRVLCLDQDQLSAQREQQQQDEDDDLVDKALDGCLHEEFDQYLLVARGEEGFDAIVALLAELRHAHPGYYSRLLARCCHLSSARIEEQGGLYAALSAIDSLEEDVAGEREERRAAQGYIAPPSALSLLALLRTTPLEELRRMTGPDPVTRAYFRRYAPAADADEQAALRGAPRWLREVLAALPAEEAPALPFSAAPRLPSPDVQADWFAAALADLQPRDPARYAERLRELNYLANVLLSGCALRGRAFRPKEAAEAVVAACNLGLVDQLLGAGQDRPRAGELRERSAVPLFRVGFARWHQELVLPAARAVLARLQPPWPTLPASARAEIQELQRDLHRALDEGKPWRVARRLPLLSHLMEDRRSHLLRALLSECPTHPGAEPTFFATPAQVQAARAHL